MRSRNVTWSDLTITIRLNLTWTAFLEWARSRTVASATRDYSEGEERLTFTDGSVAVLQSNYEGALSDVTPGAGIQPPSVHVRMPISAT